MTEAFPAPPDPFARNKAIIIEERGTHVPSGYIQHEDSQMLVKISGVPMIPPIRVGQIAPERRWAVKPDGNLLDQLTFENQFKANWTEWYRLSGVAPPKGSRPEYAYIPNVTKYVGFRVNPRNPHAKSLIPIHEPVTKERQKPKFMYDTDGERVEGDRMTILVDAYHDQGLKKSLLSSEIEEVEAHLGIDRTASDSGSGSDAIVAQLTTLLEMKNARDITAVVYDKRVAMLTGKAPDPKRQGRRWDTPCGKEVYAPHKKHHLRKCKSVDCKKLFKETYAL